MSSEPTSTVIISVNPKAGRKSPMIRAEELQGRLREKGFEVRLLTDLAEVAETSNLLHAEKRLRALVGVGGDGTAATLVNLTEPGTPITLLSAGTANLLAKHFRLGRSPQQIAEVVENGSVLTLDAGRAVTGKDNGNDNERKERLFLVMVSCGFDADIVNGVHSQREARYESGHRKGAHISYFSYVKPIMKSLFGYRFEKMKVEKFDGTDWGDVEDRVRWAFFFNMNRYGWGLPLAPYAKENDGFLDHVLFRGGTTLHGFFYLALAQCFSMHRFFSWAHMGQATKYRITSNAPLPFQLDGDPGGTLPLEIEVIPNRLTFLVPESTARRFAR